MNYWNKEIECAPRSEIEALQSYRLSRTIRRVYENVAPYRKKMDEAGVRPEDIKSIADLSKLPFTTKQDLRNNYPYGMFAVPSSEVVRIHASSGTTGKQTVVGYTAHDIDVWAECAARALTNIGGTKDDYVQVCYGYGLFTGGLGMHYGTEKLGATVIPASAGNSLRQLEMFRDFGTSIICMTPSYAISLIELMHEKGFKKEDFNLKAGLFGAEPWTDEMRKQIEDGLGINAYDIYGLTEVYGPGIGISCDAHDGIHYWDDFIYVEIIDPQTGETLPDGEWGEIVITTLRKEGAPLIRFRTHDLSRILPGDCPCGSKFPRLDTIQGRTDDMVKIKGVNLFPAQIEEILKTFPEVSSEYQIHISHLDGKDTMRLYVETNGSIDFLNLAKRIAERVKSRIGFTPLVKVVEIGVLPRSEKKTKRVIDTRYE